MQIRIHQHSFELSEPFAEGHRLSAAEAAALNSLRAENIRNNAAREIGRRGAPMPLPPAALAKFTAWIEVYDREYQFAVKAARGGPGGAAGTSRTSAPFDRALRAIALREARVMANRQGRDLVGDELESAVVALMGLSALQSEAGATVAAAQEVAQEALEDMLAEEREPRMRASS